MLIIALIALAAVCAALSNTVFDGEDAGGLLFLGFVVCLLGAVVTGVRRLRAR